MSDKFRLLRRDFVLRSGAAFIGLTAAARLGVLTESLRADELSPSGQDILNGIIDPEVRAGLDAAINKNLIPAATEQAYPGHFNISADGAAYGGNTTWPGLDSWQMAGAYLLLGRARLVLDYFDFVQASQREDGNIPFAIFPGETRPDKTYLSGMKYPEDLFTYKPPKRDGLAPYSQETHDWMRLFVHWQRKANPLSTLGPICYILTAAEIFDTTKSPSWLKGKLPSLESAAKYLLSRKSENGLISGSDFMSSFRRGTNGMASTNVMPFMLSANWQDSTGQQVKRRKKQPGRITVRHSRGISSPSSGKRITSPSTSTPNMALLIRTDYRM